MFAMCVGVGYSESPDTRTAGMQAAASALHQADCNAPCDLVLLFSTARHDAGVLRESILSVMGEDVPIVGGGAVGAISNDRYGYAGDQIILAAFWLDGVGFDVVFEGGLTGSGSEEEVGLKLGRQLAAIGARPDSPVLLFYDAIDRTGGDMRMVMGTPLLVGIERALGFYPDLIGAGLQGDYVNTPMKQWNGAGASQHSAVALAFSGDLRVDSVIMHGCRPATPYYTVTKADAQTILEIDGRPALDFIVETLGGVLSPEDLPFFLILGTNRGDKWAAFDEKSYSNRLCLAIDPERRGLVMFEPDMVAGTQFQVMYRSLDDFDYIPPRIEGLFEGLGDRVPTFALYIDCAGRAAGYAGVELEDAVVVQRAVANRVPLLGIYSGVEIASVEGRPRGLDWTGVFCLFSVSR